MACVFFHNLPKGSLFFHGKFFQCFTGLIWMETKQRLFFYLFSQTKQNCSFFLKKKSLAWVEFAMAIWPGAGLSHPHTLSWSWFFNWFFCFRENCRSFTQRKWEAQGETFHQCPRAQHSSGWFVWNISPIVRKTKLNFIARKIVLFKAMIGDNWWTVERFERLYERINYYM